MPMLETCAGIRASRVRPSGEDGEADAAQDGRGKTVGQSSGDGRGDADGQGPGRHQQAGLHLRPVQGGLEVEGQGDEGQHLGGE